MALSDIVTVNNVALALVLGGLLEIFTAFYGKKEARRKSLYWTRFLWSSGSSSARSLSCWGIQAVVVTPRPIA